MSDEERQFQLLDGDMWQAWPVTDLFVITGCSDLQNGALCMDQGIERQAREAIPNLAQALGAILAKQCGHLGFYGFLPSPRWPEAKLAVFQVRRAATEKPSDIMTVLACNRLRKWIAEHPDKRVDMVLPGWDRGLTGLEEDMLASLRYLPSNVNVWRHLV